MTSAEMKPIFEDLFVRQRNIPNFEPQPLMSSYLSLCNTVYFWLLWVHIWYTGGCALCCVAAKMTLARCLTNFKSMHQWDSTGWNKIDLKGPLWSDLNIIAPNPAQGGTLCWRFDFDMPLALLQAILDSLQQKRTSVLLWFISKPLLCNLFISPEMWGSSTSSPMNSELIAFKNRSTSSFVFSLKIGTLRGACDPWLLSDLPSFLLKFYHNRGPD